MVGLTTSVSFLFSPSLAAERSLTLPTGTRTVKVGPGHFRFVLPDRRTVEIAGLDPGTGSFSLLRVTDGSPSGAAAWGGKRGRMVNAARLSPQEASGVPPLSYARVEDAMISLPLTLVFNEVPPADLLASFMKLNVADPTRDPTTQNSLSEATAGTRCEAVGGTWDPVGRRCVHPSPDLAIEYFGIAAAPAGKKGRPALTLRIRNRGTTASAPTAAVFSGPAAVLALYGLAGSRSVPRLDPGQAHALTFSPAEKAPDIRAGNYRIGAVVNPKEASFKEAAYGNNAAALVLSVPAQGGSAKQEHEAEPSGRRADH